MSERTRNRSVVFTSTEAEATQNSAGEHTVTVRGQFTEAGYSQTNTLHLSRDAAVQLLQSLGRAL